MTIGIFHKEATVWNFRGAFPLWWYDRGNDTTFFSFIDSIYLTFYFYMLMISNGLKPKLFWDFVINCVKGERKKKPKSIILGQRFSFWHFSDFWKFRNIFWYQVKHMFLINYQCFRSYATFLLNFWHTINQISIMLLQCCYTRDIVWNVSIAA